MTDLRTSRDLAWLTARLPRFVPGAGDRSRLKPLGELAMVYAYLSRWQGDSGVQLPHARRWRDFLRDQCTSARLLATARDDRDSGLYRMQPYSWLRATGIRDAAAEQVMRELWLAGCRPTSIGQLHSLWKGGFVRPTPDWDGLLRKQLLSRSWTAELVSGEAYRITHAVFYATDLGDRRPGLDNDELTAARSVVRLVAGHSYDHGNWDRLVEAAIALRALGGAVPAGLDPAGERVQAQRIRGGLPRTSTATATFAGCYHATLVDLLDSAQRELCRSVWERQTHG